MQLFHLPALHLHAPDLLVSLKYRSVWHSINSVMTSVFLDICRLSWGQHLGNEAHGLLHIGYQDVF